MAEKEWSENPEDDPIEIQKRQLALGQKFIDRLEKQEAEEEKRKQEEKDYAAAAVDHSGVMGSAAPYKPLTFEERSVAIVKAWTETKRIVPDAPDHVKTIVFQSLLHGQSGDYIQA